MLFSINFDRIVLREKAIMPQPVAGDEWQWGFEATPP
jgi:hypothetical protein